MTNSVLIDKETLITEVRYAISQGCCISITASGNSMNPFIVHKRDSIKLGPWKDEDIRKGAVVLAEGNSGLYVIHRVIKRNGDDLTLSGDGNLIQTETTTTAKVIAVMHSITRKGREYSSSSLVWRLYSGIWMFLAPVRRYPLGIWRRLK